LESAAKYLPIIRNPDRFQGPAHWHRSFLLMLAKRCSSYRTQGHSEDQSGPALGLSEKSYAMAAGLVGE
jgi:hypothetical protein